MLSAAHVLAMDAKNLLDVVDSIRIRFADLFFQPQLSSEIILDQHHTTIPNQQNMTISCNSPPYDITGVPHQLPIQLRTNEDSSYEVQRQTYQNWSEFVDQSTSSTQPQLENNDEIYSNQQQINEHNSGIYDNDCIISAQLKKLNMTETNSKNYGDNSVTVKLVAMPQTKPPVAAKPVNLQQKLKPIVNINTTTMPPTASSVNDKNLDEPLKIIENDKDLYSNTRVTE